MFTEKGIRKNKSLLMTLFVIIFIGGYAFFFTSRLWLNPRGAATRFTKLSEVQSLEGREVSVLYWRYSEEQDEMEVMLLISNTTLDGVDTYSYTAVDANENNYETAVVCEDAALAVVQIEGIPKNWTEISLRMSLPDDTNSGDALESTQGEVLRLYTNINDVEKVSEIQTKSESEYQSERLYLMIASYEDEITAIEEEIKEEETYQETLQNEIKRLIADEEYQTDEEKAESETLIKQANGKLENSQIQEETLKDDIKELEEKIENAKELQALYEKKGEANG